MTTTLDRTPLASDKVLAYMMAGQAVITLESARTGAHYTYRLRKKQAADLWFVALLTGPDNTASYSYIGIVVKDGAGRYVFKTTAKSKAGADAPSVRGLVYALARLQDGPADHNIRYHHSGRCGRCGRALTVPESVETGLGPVCSGR